ncbi:MAG TPA: hypothetical protein VGX25_14960 [Actinophytocola sp.]|uniref:hypothetical protein n=1 Tax=Actinophytocola sp. TaxID=1872138 RepID=UPI002DDD073E|nr:hypothetical protein [Actinophytocola sp.]HEV2780687.1 hypothetical protein [Actinophytocola sp.]
MDARLSAGVFHNAATAATPTAVLGHDAAQRLGITRPGAGTRIVVGGHGSW